LEGQGDILYFNFVKYIDLSEEKTGNPVYVSGQKKTGGIPPVSRACDEVI
jgi:hypothetical protein